MKVSEHLKKPFINILEVLYYTFLKFINTVVRHDEHDSIGKI